MCDPNFDLRMCFDPNSVSFKLEFIKFTSPHLMSYSLSSSASSTALFGFGSSPNQSLCLMFYIRIPYVTQFEFQEQVQVLVQSLLGSFEFNFDFISFEF
ncbi:hypothetical protein KFK09_001779 [Dendrobium nobile]|uniref:Uncharacterized protein n=1 Tax=Dendrobium nobile TaxID=94219 RepID=A0A8T3CBV6_DENNO|nr:hypothetical protein KFK09_001779 [Dendrobium nobile]